MTATLAPSESPLIGSAAPSPAGPRHGGIDDLAPPPGIQTLGPIAQTLRLSVRQAEFMFGARRRHGDVFRSRSRIIKGDPVVTSHPDHVKSLFTAKPDEAPSLTGESPLRPIVGPSSALTALGPNHMRQRKLLLPPFHGEAIARYKRLIEEATAREVDSWPVGEPVRLAGAMQEITLDVIMAGIFGFEGAPEKGTPEYNLKRVIRHLAHMSTKPHAQLFELLQTGRTEPVGGTKLAIDLLDRVTYPVIRARRGAEDLEERNDILSLLLKATYEDGRPLTDQELRDQVLTLVLAGHETTANSLGWAFERLVRTPEAYDQLRHAVRADADSAEWVEATIHEAMRSRPVIPAIGRRVQVPWQLGDYGIDAGTPVVMSILLLHHREDLYPDPFGFRPERWLGHKPGTYEWIPFGGGIRRCLGASLAMAEMRVVLEAVARRTDMEAVDPAPERVLHRNVTMIPAGHATVVIRRKTD